MCKFRLYRKSMKNLEKREKQIIEKLDYGSTVGLAMVAFGLALLIIRNFFFVWNGRIGKRQRDSL